MMLRRVRRMAGDLNYCMPKVEVRSRRERMKTGRFLAVLVAVTMMLATAWAQDPGPGEGQQPSDGQQPSESQPSQPVDVNRTSGGQQTDAARVSFIHGDVAMQPG